MGRRKPFINKKTSTTYSLVCGGRAAIPAELTWATPLPGILG